MLVQKILNGHVRPGMVNKQPILSFSGQIMLTYEKAYRMVYLVHEAIEMIVSWGGEMLDLEV